MRFNSSRRLTQNANKCWLTMAEAASNARVRNNATVARANDAEITTDGAGAANGASATTKSKKPKGRWLYDRSK